MAPVNELSEGTFDSNDIFRICESHPHDFVKSVNSADRLALDLLDSVMNNDFYNWDCCEIAF